MEGERGDVEELEGDRGRGKVENRVEWGKGGEVGRETRTPMIRTRVGTGDFCYCKRARTELPTI